MRVSIIDQENNLMTVNIDGKGFTDLDGSGLAENIHAVQWSGTSGQVEFKNPATGEITSNQEITSLDDFQFAIAKWNEANDAESAAIAAQEEADRIAMENAVSTEEELLALVNNQ